MKKFIFFSLIVIILIVVIFNIIKPVILSSKTQDNNITYSILESSEGSSIYEEKGYYVTNKEDNKLLITIASGMKTTGGFDINIEEIKINNKDVIIFIKETQPPKNSKVNQVINYPIVQVEFSEKPESLIIKNIDNNNTYKKIT